MPIDMYVRIPLVAACLIIMFGLAGCAPGDSDLSDADTTATDTSEVIATGQNLISALEDDGRFTTLVAAFDSSGLASTLEGPGPFTLFAPTDLAFDQVASESSEDLLAPSRRQELRDILMNHLINGRRPAAELRGVTSVETMYGDELEIDVDNGALSIANASVTETDMQTDNGIIHVVGSVIIPSDAAADPATDPAAADSL